MEGRVSCEGVGVWEGVRVGSEAGGWASCEGVGGCEVSCGSGGWASCEGVGGCEASCGSGGWASCEGVGGCEVSCGSGGWASCEGVGGCEVSCGSGGWASCASAMDLMWSPGTMARPKLRGWYSLLAGLASTSAEGERDNEQEGYIRAQGASSASGTGRDHVCMPISAGHA